MVKELPFEKLRKECFPERLHCKTTKEVSSLEGIIGQKRAVSALRFGLEIRNKGFNIYVSGRPGTGRETAVKNFLEIFAKNKPTPPDLCYVNNFNDPYEPTAVELPHGMGKVFSKDIGNLLSEIRTVLPKVFKSDDYATKSEATVKKINEEKKKLFSQLEKRAKKEGFVLQSNPMGLLIIPVIDGKPISEKEFISLKPEIKGRIKKKREGLSKDLRNAVRRIKSLESKVNEELKKMNHKVALFAIDHLVDDLREKYKDFPDIVHYLSNLQDDVLNNLAQFIKKEKNGPSTLTVPGMSEVPFKKYAVNVIVDNSQLEGAPVVTEHNPTYQNLFGKIEKESRFGVLTTDFTMIHSGSLHKANGGYLVIIAEDLLRNRLSWNALKRDLENESIPIEEVGELLGFVTTKGLRPEPIPIKTKVILIGKQDLYHLLYRYDMEFKELFKVKAEFDTTMSRTLQNEKKYAAFISTLCRKENLKHLNGTAVAKIVEQGSRIAEDQKKLTTKFAEIADIVREASFYASQKNSRFITTENVKKAIEEKIYRSNLIEEKIQEMIQKGIFIIDTKGVTVGQVNGLAVMGMGDFSFGRPNRVTASIGLGKEGIIDIEREAKLGGPIHTKGVLILGGYLAEKYAQDKPLSLSARLVFEQSYGEIEGDSASSTELYAILSALSGLSVKQSIAVTGSVNQKGEIQAIGGVNEKIEGFFEVCKIKGLTGNQGTIIPESNIENLMLKEEVVKAVKLGKFHIYPIKSIDQGIEILTGVKAGKRKSDGTFKKGTINYYVDKRLKEMLEKLQKFAKPSEKGKKEGN